MRAQTRLAKATAHTELELLEVEAQHFLSFTEGLPHIGHNLSALRRLERLSNGVTVIQYNGEVDAQAALITIYHKESGRSLIGVLLISLNQYSAQLYDVDEGPQTGSLISCPAPAGKRRELWLKDQRLTRIETLGSWSELSALQAAMLAQTQLPPERLDQLLTPSPLKVNDTPAPFPSSVEGPVCTCMQLSADDLINAMRRGACTLSDLIEQTAVGTCCGGCLPSVATLCQDSIGQPAVITQKIKRSPGVYTLVLRPTQGEPLHEAQPGQHIIISLKSKEGWISRPYTLTTPPTQNERREVTIKRIEGGSVSHLLTDSDMNAHELRISEPRGRFNINPLHGPPIIFFAAGIGVTPALSFAYAISAHESSRAMYLHHSARSAQELIFSAE